MKLPNVLLMGDSGTGKTMSLLTLPEAGITPFIIATESNAFTQINRMPCPKLHYRYIKPGAPSWDALANSLDQVNKLSNDLLQKLAGVEKHKHNQILQVVGACANFVCDRCGEKFGDVASWGEDRALVIDSFSGINDLAMANTVGGKPILTQPDWGVAMRSELMLIQMLTNIPSAMFVCIAHLTQERDPVSGRILKMPNALGQKVAPDLPRQFTDVITAVREGTKFTWSTMEADTVSAARHFPLASGLKPSFVQIMDEWRKVAKVDKVQT